MMTKITLFLSFVGVAMSLGNYSFTMNQLPYLQDVQEKSSLGALNGGDVMIFKMDFSTFVTNIPNNYKLVIYDANDFMISPQPTGFNQAVNVPSNLSSIYSWTVPMAGTYYLLVTWGSFSFRSSEPYQIYYMTTTQNGVEIFNYTGVIRYRPTKLLKLNNPGDLLVSYTQSSAN